MVHDQWLKYGGGALERRSWALANWLHSRNFRDNACKSAFRRSGGHYINGRDVSYDEKRRRGWLGWIGRTPSRESSGGPPLGMGPIFFHSPEAHENYTLITVHDVRCRRQWRGVAEEDWSGDTETGRKTRSAHSTSRTSRAKLSTLTTTTTSRDRSRAVWGHA